MHNHKVAVPLTQLLKLLMNADASVLRGFNSAHAGRLYLSCARSHCRLGLHETHRAQQDMLLVQEHHFMCTTLFKHTLST